MKVELLDSMGSDLTVVNAARVSVNKESAWVRLDLKGHEIEWKEFEGLECRRLRERDKKLIRYLATGTEAKGREALIERIRAAESEDEAADIITAIRRINEHWSPFSHVMAQFRITAPLFVARQLWKSHVGVAGGDVGEPGWNEVSRRYVDAKPEFYEPPVWRARAESVKQGSGDAFHNQLLAREQMDRAYREAARSYRALLDWGVCPEQARIVLPQGMILTWWWTGSLLFFARVCRLRLDAHAQAETQEIARQIAGHMAGLFPVSWAALMGEAA